MELLETLAVALDEYGELSERSALAPAARRALLAWYRRSRRDLPWRRPRTSSRAPREPQRQRHDPSRQRRDPWKVWVSEVMLQQTRVEAVIEPYRRFIRKFPSLAAMAKADEDDVLTEWSGLGYYRRARLLHAGARHVAAAHGGRIPRSREALENIPGIGTYTAGAILSIAFGEREAALDSNVLRVVARLGAVRDSRSAAGRAQVCELAMRLVDCARPGEINEALMDLGSAVCTARDARCDRCPLARLCKARASGDPLAFAALRTRKPPREVELACAVVADEDRVLLVRRSRDDSLLGGLWELPTILVRRSRDAIDVGTDSRGIRLALKRLIRSRAGLDVTVRGPLVRVRHDIVGRRIVAAVYAATIRGKVAGPFPEARMLAAAGRRRVAMSALPAKVIDAYWKGSRASAERAIGGRAIGDRATNGRAAQDRATPRSRAARGAV